LIDWDQQSALPSVCLGVQHDFLRAGHSLSATGGMPKSLDPLMAFEDLCVSFQSCGAFDTKDPQRHFQDMAIYGQSWQGL